MDREEIAKLLTEKGALKPCHRCGAKSFTILEGYSNIHLQENLNAGMVIGGPSVPVAHIVCDNCGALTPHAIGALGLLPKEEGNNNE